MVAGEPGRGGRQVVGGGGGQAVGAPALGGKGQPVAVPVPFEPQHRGAEHPALVQRLAHPGLDGAEVLADHQRPGARGLQGQYREHRLGVVADVRPLRGRLPLRDPPEPEQAHDVVDAQGARVAEEGAQEAAVGGVAGRRPAGPGARAAGPSPGRAR